VLRNTDCDFVWLNSSSFALHIPQYIENCTHFFIYYIYLLDNKIFQSPPVEKAYFLKVGDKFSLISTEAVVNLYNLILSLNSRVFPISEFFSVYSLIVSKMSP